MGLFSMKTRGSFYLKGLGRTLSCRAEDVTALKQGSRCKSDGRNLALIHRDLALRRLFAAIHIAGNDDTDCLYPARHITNTVESTFGKHVFIPIITMI